MKDEEDSRLLKAVEAIAISPTDAKHLVSQYQKQAKKSHPQKSEAEINKIVGKKIISRYCKMSAVSGGTTALAGIVPGVGTAVSMIGGGLTDATVSMKLQVDMCMCLAETYGWDLTTQDAKHLSFLIAVGGALEQTGTTAATAIASKAGVRMVKTYLTGAILVTIKEMFKKIGIVFTRKALEKSIPFGIGVVIGTSANYALTKYVGNSALDWFILESQE